MLRIFYDQWAAMGYKLVSRDKSKLVRLSYAFIKYRKRPAVQLFYSEYECGPYLKEYLLFFSFLNLDKNDKNSFGIHVEFSWIRLYKGSIVISQYIPRAIRRIQKFLAGHQCP